MAIDWRQFILKPQIKNLPLQEQMRLFRWENTYNQYRSRSGESTVNNVQAIKFSTNHGLDFENVVSQSAFPSNNVTTNYSVLRVYQGFTASIHVAYNYPVQVTGTPLITDITNSEEGAGFGSGIPRPNSSPIFTYTAERSTPTKLAFEFIQSKPISGSNPNRFEFRASGIRLGGDPSFLGNFSSSINTNTITGVSASATYLMKTLHWHEGSPAADFNRSGSTVPLNISASIVVDAAGKITKIIPNDGGIGASSYTEYIAGNHLTLKGNTLDGGTGSAIITISGLHNKNGTTLAEQFLFYPTGSNYDGVTFIDGLEGDSAKIENEAGFNNLGSINTVSGSIVDPTGRAVSLALNDGSAYNDAGVYVREPSAAISSSFFIARAI